MARLLAAYLIVVPLVLVACSQTPSPRRRAVDVTILYTWDAEAQTEAVSSPFGCAGEPVGGFARRASVIESVRADGGPVLVLDAGNTLASPNDQIVPQATCETALEAMNLMGYQGMVLGEDDLRLGATALRGCIAHAQFPVVSANVVDLSTRKALSKPFAIVQVGDSQTVGIIGLTGVRGRGAQSSTVQPRAGGSKLAITDAASALAKAARELRGRVDLLITLTNLDWDVCTRLAESVSGIDLIMCAGEQGGTALTSWQAPSTGAWVCSVQLPGLYDPAWVVGEVRVKTTAQGGIALVNIQPLKVNNDVPEDQEVASLLLSRRVSR